MFTFADVRSLQRNVTRCRSRGIVNNSYIGTSYIYVFFSKHCYITICLAFPFVVSSLPSLFDARRGLLTPSAACFVHVCFLLSTVMMCVALCKRFTPLIDLFTKVVADFMKNDSLRIHDIKPRSGILPD